jgi:ankyrin repeat protein
VCQQTSPRELVEAARGMPIDPSAIYSRTMEQINLQPPAQAKLAKRILSWLTLAFRSLTLRELIDALAVEPSRSVVDPLNKRSASMLAKVCRGLVLVDQDHNIIQLAHKTVQDYLMASDMLDLSSMQREIFISCLTYLSLDTFRESPCATAQDLALRRGAYPFVDYAATYLGDHLNLLPLDLALLEKAYSFANDRPLTEYYFQLRDWTIVMMPLTISLHYRKMSALHIAAIIGNTAVVRLVLSRQPQLLDSVDSTRSTALGWAVNFGHEDVAEVLLKEGAEITNCKEETLLNCAARNRLDGIVCLLIEHDTLLRNRTLRLSGEENERDLHVAVIKGDGSQVGRILKRKVDVDARDSDGGTALQWAAWYDHTTIVEQLLNCGADINAADHTSGRSALHEASEKGNYDTMKLLLDRGVSMDAPDRWNWTALHRAAFQGDREAVELLLSYGTDINAKTGHGCNALQLACINAQLDTIRLLIERGIGYDGFSLADLDFNPSISEIRLAEVQSLISALIPQWPPIGETLSDSSSTISGLWYPGRPLAISPLRTPFSDSAGSSSIGSTKELRIDLGN